MAKANRWFREGNTFRKLNYIKIPLKERQYRRNKWLFIGDKE